MTPSPLNTTRVCARESDNGGCRHNASPVTFLGQHSPRLWCLTSATVASRLSGGGSVGQPRPWIRWKPRCGVRQPGCSDSPAGFPATPWGPRPGVRPTSIAAVASRLHAGSGHPLLYTGMQSRLKALNFCALNPWASPQSHGAKPRPEGLSRGIVPLLPLCQPYVGLGSDEGAAGRVFSTKTNRRVGREKPGDRRRRCRVPRAKSRTKIGFYWRNNPEKASAAVFLLEINRDRVRR